MWPHGNTYSYYALLQSLFSGKFKAPAGSDQACEIGEGFIQDTLHETWAYAGKSNEHERTARRQATAYEV